MGMALNLRLLSQKPKFWESLEVRMFFRNLKIAAKLLISGLVFLLPITVMSYIIITGLEVSVFLLSLVGGTILFALFILILMVIDSIRSAESLKRLFTGLEENDLSLSLTARSGDEFGKLITVFNQFLNRLRDVFNAFSHDANLVVIAVYELSSSAKQITTTANQQSASVSEIVSTMENNKNLSEQMAAKTAEVADLAAQTQDFSLKGVDLWGANQAMMEEIRAQNAKIINEIKNLSDMIQRINEAIGIIDGIADQTKLIAFNASLEASSSGEAGARFAVVAAEIRRFADNVVDSTREIKQKIEEVQAASQSLIAEANSGSKQIDQGYDRMVEQKAVFENIVENSQNVATRSQQISNLSKQQEYASSQIFVTLKEISAGVKQFVTATASTSKIADNLNVMSRGLQDTVGKYRTSN
jgi:methyl-accepting chemotaxis protein